MNSSSNKFKKELESLYTQEQNLNCFDCDKHPAHWASVNNGIYLCMDCSGEHRGFGVSTSFIKSVTLDQWTEPQVNLMKVGGNQRLKEFLTKFEMPDYLDRIDIYNSKIMAYYRRQLKSESKGELFMEPLPSASTFWDKSSTDDIIFDNKSYSNSLFSGNSNTSSGYNPSLFNDNDRIDLSGGNSNDKSKYPKSEIVIPDNHYQKGNSYSAIASNFSSSVPSEPKFAKIDPKYANDPRFASIGSEPVDTSGSASNSYLGSLGGYLGGFGSVLGTMWNTGVGAASAIKDKMNEYSVGSKLVYVGSKTIEAVGYVGSKVIEKGGEVIQSETVHNLASKAGEGLGYLKNKIVGGSSGSQNSNSISSDNYNSGNYSSTSSDTYYNKY